MSYRFLHFSESIARLDRLMRKAKMNGTRDLGLKSSHTMILYLLHEKPEGRSFAEMAALSISDTGLMSRTLKELRDLNLIEKIEVDGKYKAVYQLTSEGRARASSIAARIEQAENIVSADISEEDVNAFYRVADQITRNIEKLPSQWRINE